MAEAGELLEKGWMRGAGGLLENILLAEWSGVRCQAESAAYGWLDLRQL